MKKKMLIMTVAAASMLFACQRHKDNEQQALADASKQELVQALNERDQLLSLVNEVTTGLEEIKQLENIMTVTARNPEKNASQRAQLQADMASVKERIEQRQAELKVLEGKLAKANLGNTKLKETVKTLQAQIDTQLEEIETLKQQLAAAQEQIGTLTGEVGTLHSTVSTVTDERNAAKEASAQLEKALNTCYYVVGTKAELKAQKIIETGFLRKTKLMQSDFNQSSFVISDKRVLSTLPLQADKVKVLTNHPADSYELAEVNGLKVLKIKDAAAFWSLSNYLVVQKN